MALKRVRKSKAKEVHLLNTQEYPGSESLWGTATSPSTLRPSQAQRGVAAAQAGSARAPDWCGHSAHLRNLPASGISGKEALCSGTVSGCGQEQPATQAQTHRCCDDERRRLKSASLAARGRLAQTPGGPASSAEGLKKAERSLPGRNFCLKEWLHPISESRPAFPTACLTAGRRSQPDLTARKASSSQ